MPVFRACRSVQLTPDGVGPTGRRAGLIGGPDVWEVGALVAAVLAIGDQTLNDLFFERTDRA
jgi:hypothetical protein